MNTLKITLAAVVVALGSTAASAQSNGWLSVGELTNKLQAQGYTVRSIDHDDDGYFDVEITDRKGVRYDAAVDRKSGAIIHRDRDDDHYDRYDD